METVSKEEMFGFIKWMNEYHSPELGRGTTLKRFAPQIPTEKDSTPTWIETLTFKFERPKFWTIEEIWKKYQLEMSKKPEEEKRTVADY